MGREPSSALSMGEEPSRLSSLSERSTLPRVPQTAREARQTHSELGPPNGDHHATPLFHHHHHHHQHHRQPPTVDVCAGYPSRYQPGAVGSQTMVAPMMMPSMDENLEEAALPLGDNDVADMRPLTAHEVWNATHHAQTPPHTHAPQPGRRQPSPSCGRTALQLFRATVALRSQLGVCDQLEAQLKDVKHSPRVRGKGNGEGSGASVELMTRLHQEYSVLRRLKVPNTH
mmetsp:Transcript_39318/g.92473  ORF Transcript_39318/g.92473 Transcript_39318/m.92473 type:complete len:229 (-) Transcript_39318:931-1617(-)